jgi:hypothetical protein
MEFMLFLLFKIVKGSCRSRKELGTKEDIGAVEENSFPISTSLRLIVDIRYPGSVNRVGLVVSGGLSEGFEVRTPAL